MTSNPWVLIEESPLRAVSSPPGLPPRRSSNQRSKTMKNLNDAFVNDLTKGVSNIIDLSKEQLQKLQDTFSQ